MPDDIYMTRYLALQRTTLYNLDCRTAISGIGHESHIMNTAVVDALDIGRITADLVHSHIVKSLGRIL